VERKSIYLYRQEHRMAHRLTRFESFAEKFVEGTFDRLLGRRLEPVEIARQLTRIMEDNQTIGAGKIFVPNVYRVGLHPETFQTFVSFKEPLEAELATYLAEEAEYHGFDFIGRPHVVLTVETGVRRGRCTVHAELAGTPSGSGDHTADTQAFHIGAIRAAAIEQAQKSPLGEQLQLIVDQRIVPLRNPPISLGRSLENDVIIQAPKVSRRHAQIVFRHGRWLLRDLQSTHGTYVNGHAIEECVLRTGDTITLGDVVIKVQGQPATAAES
jgi:hypothetical protein